jgi:hypothetical protein
MPQQSPPPASNVLDAYLKEARARNKRLEIRWWLEDPKYIRVLKSGVYDGSTDKTYQAGEIFLCKVSHWVEGWWNKGEVEILNGGAGDHALVYEGDRYKGSLFKPWDIPSPEHSQLGPVKLIDHDLYAPVRLRGSARLHELISFFDLSPLSAPGFSFWADWASLWHRLPGRFCICEQGTIIWGESDAPLELLRPT